MIRPIAIHLPQFHPVPENDAWWGKGFTEWTNVVKAKPLFEGHYQPHLPADLGFYDLRLPEARQAQANLAREYGFHGFCYYHYWFNGRRILEKPVEEILRSGKPDFPFMLCWANENWTRVWDGGEQNILLQQNYSSDDDRAHMRFLIDYFKDPRYIRINNKPVFAVYRSTLLPDMSQTIRVWREEAGRHGLEIYICRFESGGVAGKQYLEAGFDAAIEFQPHAKHVQEHKIFPHLQPMIEKKGSFLRSMRETFKTGKRKAPGHNGMLFPYRQYIDVSLQHEHANDDYKLYRCVSPGWDNSPRRQSGYALLYDSKPEHFRFWTQEVLKRFKPFSNDENLFFVNAWNEWAEGNHLEPCQRWGKGYLEAAHEVFKEYNG